MKDLAKWQIISVISRGVAMLLGLFQSYFIVKILTVGEWGIIQIAVSIGGVFGIYQHLGLASGSTREISAAKDDTQIFKIFLTSALIRYVITIPLAIFLFFSAPSLAARYNDVTLIQPLQIFSLVLLVQGLQSILNSVISGTKRFKQLFLYQALIAMISVIMFIPTIYLYRINGYFYALLTFNIVCSITLGIIAFAPLKHRWQLPTKKEFKTLLKELLSISLAIYAAKIIYTMWEKSGPILLGLHVTKEMVGVFAFALLYAKKLMALSDAVTDVSLPILSEKYVHDFNDFKNVFSRNFDKLYALTLLLAAPVIYWAPEIVKVAGLYTKYSSSLPYILPLAFAYILYSFVNIVKSSVIIPAKMVVEMLSSFAVLIITTVVFYFIGARFFGYLPAMAYGLAAGAFLAFLTLAYFSRFKLNFNFFTHSHFLVLVQVLVIGIVGGIEDIYVKSFLFIVLGVLLLWGMSIAKLITKEEMLGFLTKLRQYEKIITKNRH